MFALTDQTQFRGANGGSGWNVAVKLSIDIDHHGSSVPVINGPTAADYIAGTGIEKAKGQSGYSFASAKFNAGRTEGTENYEIGVEPKAANLGDIQEPSSEPGDSEGARDSTSAGGKSAPAPRNPCVAKCKYRYSANRPAEFQVFRRPSDASNPSQRSSSGARKTSATAIASRPE
jgi:hypothetical protein